MYKIYIADDETIIRKGLINGIDWAALNCQVIGSASDGKKAYNEILRLRPDILLTDIKMPLLDGLEMIALLRRQLSDLYIIVITGYSEFSFAQRAVKLGVYDFILKPIDIDYLCKVILNIENKIDDCRSEHSAVSLYSNFRGELSLSEAQALWNAVFSPDHPASSAQNSSRAGSGVHRYWPHFLPTHRLMRPRRQWGVHFEDVPSPPG